MKARASVKGTTDRRTERGQAPNTKERVLQAATREFAREGFSGARVDRIAKASGANIRMIYYFFGSKKGLLEAVLRSIFDQRLAREAPQFDTVADLLDSYFDRYAEDPELVRLLVWEALQTRLPEKSGQLTNFEDRRRAMNQRIAAIAELQRRGKIPAGLDPKLLYLVFVALTIYPFSYPQSLFIATGRLVTSDGFKRKYSAFLKQLADALFK